MSKRQSDGNSDASTLAAYLRQISKVPLLTLDEERSLGLRIRGDRDEEAVSKLVESNLRFVVSCARRYRGCGVSMLELIHEGNLGLIEAARRFDPSHNVKFVTYAAWWVRQAMMHVMPDETRVFSNPSPLIATFSREAVDVSRSDADELAEALHGLDTRPRERSDRVRLARERLRRIASHTKGELSRSVTLLSYLN